MKVPIWVLYREWEGGHSIELFSTQADAYSRLHKIVLDNWADVMGEDYGMPIKILDAIHEYFEDSGEVYNIIEKFVDLPITPPGAPIEEDVVEFSPREVEATLQALDTCALKLVAQRLGITEMTADQVLCDVYAKLKS